jgi:hypothetical protein
MTKPFASFTSKTLNPYSPCSTATTANSPENAQSSVFIDLRHFTLDFQIAFKTFKQLIY